MDAVSVDDVADVTIGTDPLGQWFFWETEYPEDMCIGTFDNEAACRAGVEDFYKGNNPFTTGKTNYAITARRVSKAKAVKP
jgi:hypothetical protein